MSGIEEWILLATAHIAFPPDRKPVSSRCAMQGSKFRIDELNRVNIRQTGS